MSFRLFSDLCSSPSTTLNPSLYETPCNNIHLVAHKNLDISLRAVATTASILPDQFGLGMYCWWYIFITYTH